MTFEPVRFGLVDCLCALNIAVCDTVKDSWLCVELGS